MDIWVISPLWLLWKMLLGTFKFLYKHMFSLLLDIYVGVERLGCMINIYLVIWAIGKQFSKIMAPFCNLTSNEWEFHILHICLHLLWSILILDILVGMEWYVIVLFDLHFPSDYPLMILSIFSCAGWPLINLLFRNVYSNPLLILKLRYLCFL